MIEAARIAKAHGVGRREQAEPRVGRDHPVLIEQGQAAIEFQNALDHEHNVRAARVIFVESQRNRVLQRPRQDAFLELGDLQAILQHDRIAADQIDAADMRIEVHADARPVQPRGNLFDMGRFAGAVIALHHHPAVMRKAGENRQGGVRIEHIGAVGLGHVLAGMGEGGHLPIDINAEDLADVDRGVGLVGHGVIAGDIILGRCSHRCPG